MKFKSYKGVRITRDGSRYYAEQEELGKVQITPNNALNIFMSCTSFCGDIQNELFKIGTSGAHTILYPEHHEMFKAAYQEEVVETDAFVERYRSLEFGDTVMNLYTNKPMMFLGKFHYITLQNTKYFWNIHNNKSKQPNSSKGNMFLCNTGKVYILPTKGNILKSKISFDCNGKMDLHLSLIPKSDAIEILKRYTDDSKNRFIDGLQNRLLEVAYVDEKRFDGCDINSTKVMQGYTLQELADDFCENRSRHFIEVNGHWVTLASANIQYSILNFSFFEGSKTTVREEYQKVKPLFLQFYRS